MPIPFYRPKPAPPDVFKGQPLPMYKANPLSIFFFQWLSPILKVGYSRPLEPDDLWDLTPDLQAQNVADVLERHYMARLPPSRRTEKYRPAPAPIAETTYKEAETPSAHAQLSPPVVPSDRRRSSVTSSLTVQRERQRRASSTSFFQPIDQDTVEELADGTHDFQFGPNPSMDIITRAMSRTAEEAREEQQLDHAERLEANEGEDKVDEDLVKTYGKRKAKKIADDRYALEDGVLYDMSLVKAMFFTTWRYLWLGITLYVFGNGLRITAPLVTEKIIQQLLYAKALHDAEVSGQPTDGLTRPKPVGYGIGLAFALFVQQFFGSWFIYLQFQVMSNVGFRLRAALVDLISRKSMRLSGKARLEMTNGKLTNMISADAAYLDWVIPWLSDFCVNPIQIIIGVALLIRSLGYSALVGVGVLIIAAPAQGVMYKSILQLRRRQEAKVDKRVRLISEVLNNIRAVKLFAFESLFGAKVREIRQQEHADLRKFGLLRSGVNATFVYMPILSAVLTFVTYGLTGHELNPATIFSSLQLFNVLARPLTNFPLAISSLMDATAAIGRIGKMLRSEELREKMTIEPNAKYAVEVSGDFQFDSAAPPDQHANDDDKEKKKKKDASDESVEKPADVSDEDQVPFALRDVALRIPRGALVCIVGRVGTGKTALLLGLINEMRQIHGSVTFCGPVSYVPQHAWVQSGTVRDNITFAADSVGADMAKVNEVIRACCLEPDMALWPDGDLTAVGEKGITLSGGQRQRICIARAAYQKSDIVLLDDPLSAVDAHVGHHLLEKCIVRGPLADRTRLLVTHHLDVLPRADLILVMDREEGNVGRIIQQGSYQDLVQQEGVFRTLIQEFGSTAQPSSDEEDEDDGAKPAAKAKTAQAVETTQASGKLMIDEERITGSVSWGTHVAYLRATGSWTWVAICVAVLLLSQGAAVGNSLMLGYWSGNEIPGFSQGQYMGVYAALGAAIALFTWASIYFMTLAGLRGSYTLFNGAWAGVMHSPTSWHDRTPTGRIVSRLSKDIEMLDDRLAQWWNQFFLNLLAVAGAFALIVYTYAWLGFIFLPIAIFYYLALIFYRQTSRELKRIDSLLRSHVYTSFGEQLAGLAVIRAFNRQTDFAGRLQKAINSQGRAYILSIAIQRWLGCRLEVTAQCVVLMVAIFGAIFRETVNPSRFGVVLTYALSTTSILNSLVTTFAYCEQEMNNVERVQHYTALESEAAGHLPTDPEPDEPWPTEGRVNFNDVQLRYRPELPLVLKGLTFQINPGEKVGIIGRTGAGKSSVAQALFRTVELCGGSIVVDGRNLAELGLETLRNRLAIIPQEAFLFAGTVRENIDPSGTHSDAVLNDALSLIQSNPSASQSMHDKFKLDTSVQNEGSNFSAGERQLLALMRAIVRRCKVLMLDEATSSVDPETDALIQRIIQTEFSDVTLISIAHRLQTVAFYDRILVLDAGQIAEFDTPLALFDQPGSIFRDLCDTKKLSREDILRIQQEAAGAASRRETH